MNSYFIIGAGRLSRHIQHYFTFLNIPFSVWSRKENSEDELPVLLKKHDCILLLISDDAIFSFYNQHLKNAGKIVIQMSGCLPSQTGLYSFHPLMTFSQTMYDPPEYLKIPFISDQTERSFSDLFPDLPNPNYMIPSEDKALYHAYCVMSGNFSTILWESVMREFQTRWRLPKSVLMPYFQQMASNVVNAPESTSVLTGPLVRGDQSVMARHLDVLPNEESKKLYRAFIEFYQTRKLL